MKRQQITARDVARAIKSESKRLGLRSNHTWKEYVESFIQAEQSDLASLVFVANSGLIAQDAGLLYEMIRECRYRIDLMERLDKDIDVRTSGGWQ